MNLLKISAALLIASLAVPVFAAPAPKTIGFMGILNTAAGVHAHGNISVALSLYTAASGGAAVWSENQNVAATNGLFSTSLGSVNPLTNVDFSVPLFVGIKVAGDAAELAPRIPLQGVPYAMFAQTVADNSVTSAKIATDTASLGRMTGDVIRTGSYNVGIGRPPVSNHTFAVEGDSYLKGHIFLHAYEGDNTSGTAFIQGRDDSGTTNIGLQLRTQKAGSLTDVMYLAPGGNVGIGTNAPAARLDVRGDIRLGSDGGDFVVRGSQALRVVSGFVNTDGTISGNSSNGFTVVKNGTGLYTVTFSSHFSAIAGVFANSVAANYNATAHVGFLAYSGNTVSATVYTYLGSTPLDLNFCIAAIGLN